MAGYPFRALGGRDVTLVKSPGLGDERRLIVFGVVQAEKGFFPLETLSRGT